MIYLGSCESFEEEKDNEQDRGSSSSSSDSFQDAYDKIKPIFLTVPTSEADSSDNKIPISNLNNYEYHNLFMLSILKLQSFDLNYSLIQSSKVSNYKSGGSNEILPILKLDLALDQISLLQSEYLQLKRESFSNPKTKNYEILRILLLLSILKMNKIRREQHKQSEEKDHQDLEDLYQNELKIDFLPNLIDFMIYYCEKGAVTLDEELEILYFNQVENNNESDIFDFQVIYPTSVSHISTTSNSFNQSTNSSQFIFSTIFQVSLLIDSFYSNNFSFSQVSDDEFDENIVKLTNEFSQLSLQKNDNEKIRNLQHKDFVYEILSNKHSISKNEEEENASKDLLSNPFNALFIKFLISKLYLRVGDLYLSLKFIEVRNN